MYLSRLGSWLKAGIMEESGEVIHPVTGTPQGGNVWPVLANIYLHYALDQSRIGRKRSTDGHGELLAAGA